MRALLLMLFTLAVALPTPVHAKKKADRLQQKVNEDEKKEQKADDSLKRRNTIKIAPGYTRHQKASGKAAR